MSYYRPDISGEELLKNPLVKAAADTFNLKAKNVERQAWLKSLSEADIEWLAWHAFWRMRQPRRAAMVDKIQSFYFEKAAPVDPLEYALSDLDKMIDWASPEIKGMLMGFMKQMRSQKRWAPSEKQREIIVSLHAEYRARDPEEPEDMELIE